jgi:hypothetical protein
MAKDLNALDSVNLNSVVVQVIVYVEGYDDVAFWRGVLSEYESDDLTFEVMLPSRTSLARGKKSAIMNRLGNGLGTSMIACVDADYDYLMQGASPFSKTMLNSRYIIHTVAYAIENYHCYAPGLREVCVMSTLNDKNIFDFENYLKSYSEIIYDLFVWSIWFHRTGNASEFSLTAFGNATEVRNLNIFRPETALEELRHSVNRKMAWLQRKYPQAKGKLKPLKEEMQRLGVRPDNAYMFIRGHHLLDNVVMVALEPVCTRLRREREKEIKMLAEHAQQMDNELSNYSHSQIPADQIIRRTMRYKESEAYGMVRQQVERFLQLLPQKKEEPAGE